MLLFHVATISTEAFKISILYVPEWFVSLCVYATKRDKEQNRDLNFAQHKDAEQTNARGRQFWLCQGEEPSST